MVDLDKGIIESSKGTIVQMKMMLVSNFYAIYQFLTYL